MFDMSSMSAGHAQGASPSAFFTPPVLPRGGGTLTGSAGALSAGGADGTASWSIPLPVSALPARPFAPQLVLSYSSGGGNSEFGLGWQLSVPCIRRYTRRGVPHYPQAHDVIADDFRVTGPDGTELLRVGDMVRKNALPFMDEDTQYEVTAWQSRISGPAVRYELWALRRESGEVDKTFWITWQPDGSLSLYGWSARLADVAVPHYVAEWCLEEQVTARGEHIVWTWQQEDLLGEGLSEDEARFHGGASNLYLTGVYWANVTPAVHFLLPAGNDPVAANAADWLCALRFDYGERGTPGDQPPPYQAGSGTQWTGRPDCFSHWHYGFEVRTRRLCQDILLFHRTGLLAGETDATPALVTRLLLTHELSGVMSGLSSAQIMAYEAEGTRITLPPIEFALSQPDPLPDASGQWTLRTDLDGFCPSRWQMADLYGEGLPGLLYQDSGAWWYRAPERAAGDNPDAITWGKSAPLPAVPATGQGQLMDLDADGQPEWLLSLPGITGSFTLAPDGQWGAFIPLGALPSEFSHPQAQLVDLTGGGLQDLVMIGPRSVRLWPSRGREGWARGSDVAYDGTRALPVEGGGQDRLIAFTDMPGSGQQHLTEITASSVTYWPSLGHGQFGEPVSLSGFSVPPETFSPSRLWLADTDGSGVVDILYLGPDGIQVFINESGNRLVPAGVIPLPAGVGQDATLMLQVADVQGNGTNSLLLTVPHMVPRTWQLDLNTLKPWLLEEICDNTGGRTLLEYRSSAQGWLDEKAALQAAGKPAVSYLPFPVHAVHRITSVSDITGLCMGTETRYFGGVWDAEEREFGGFSRLVQTDTNGSARGTAAELSPPAQVRTWFMTGVEARDRVLSDTFRGLAEFPSQAVRFTRPEGQSQDEVFTPTEEERAWLYRALRGMVVRTETYGLDDSPQAGIPYRVTTQRWQVRACLTASTLRPAALVTPVEGVAYGCERITSDPVISQTIVLEQDALGTPLRNVSISYPRQQYAAEDYPDTLPDGLLAASRDEQQYVGCLTLSRTAVHNLLADPVGLHVIGLPKSDRTDVLKLTEATLPAEGFSVEFLLGESSPLADLSSATLVGYSRVYWRADDGETQKETPTRQALAACTETALLDNGSLAAFRDTLTPAELEALLAQGGYHATQTEDGLKVWTSIGNITFYHGEGAFWSPRAVRESELTGLTTLEYGPHQAAIKKVTDAAGLTSTIDVWDWRFMAPVQITDASDNQQYVGLDALGRVTQSRFWGTENGKPMGYSKPEAVTFRSPATVEEALALKNIPVAAAHIVFADSWMPFLRDAGGKCTAERVGELALRRWLKADNQPLALLSEGRTPPHILSLQTDHYDNDPAQQVRIQVAMSDGAGQALQTAALHPPGEAFVRTADGRLETDANGKAVTVQVAVRWAVTGKSEYDNKGNVVRIWQPYFLNDWQYVHDSSAREGLYADTHVYDAVGRKIRVLTAAGFERQVRYFPWFTVAEDENDTLQAVEARRKSEG
ncbi:SpvB/TcaC N-terminal domain-containing protein [Enterobacteriaceae bacterium LUAb1]